MRRLSGSLVLLLTAGLVHLASGLPAAAAAVQCGGSDFNGDGRNDLAVGAVEEGIGSIQRAGVVNVIYGTGAGLAASGNQMWHQDVAGIGDAAEEDDRFGFALTSGDFDGDGFDDLAVGVLGEDVGTAESAGAVNVIYGGPSGLTSAGSQFWTQDTPGIGDSSEAFDDFGSSLAACDFNGDGRDDLAVGVQSEDLGSAGQAGAVNTIYGSPNGLTSTGSQFWTQDTPGVGDSAELNDNFGWALAAGDFNGNGKADLAVGVPFEDAGPTENAGAVNVIYGGSSGLTSTGSQFWTQDTAGVGDSAEQFDDFGWALAAGDFNGSGHADLAVGVQGEDVGTIDGAGAVNVIFGGSSGLTSTGSQFWNQDTPGVGGSSGEFDHFGFSLAAGDFNGNGKDDLAVGVPFENVGSADNSAGAVNVLYGASGGLSSTGSQFWTQDTSGIADSPEDFDVFGFTLTSADFRGSGRSDLAVGVPYESVGSVGNAGAVHVIYGTSTALSSAGSQFWNQDVPGIIGSCEPFDSFSTLIDSNFVFLG